MKAAGEVEIVHYTDVGGTAMSIRGALQIQGLSARVVALPGNLSVGPIDPQDPGARWEWFRTVLQHEPNDDEREADWFEADGFETDGPWVEATSGSIRPVYWVCFDDAREHASFLAFADRMAGKPFDVIDATGLDIVARRGVRTILSLFEVSVENIVASGLMGRRRPFTRAESEVACATWARLRRENAPLRLVHDGELVSAPLTYFDAFLAGQAKLEWEVAAKLIGTTMIQLCDGIKLPAQRASAVFLLGRILAMGKAGVLEVTGPGPGMRDYKVRAPVTRDLVAGGPA